MQRDTRDRTRTGSTATDQRSILSLLPGRMIARQLLEREVVILREQITGGENKQWIALLPGLEMELRRVTEGIEAMGAGMAATVMAAAGNGRQSGEADADVEIAVSVPRQLAADTAKSAASSKQFSASTASSDLSQSEMLTEAFATSTDHTVDIPALTAQYGYGKNSLYVVVSEMRKKGSKIITLGGGKFKLIKRGRPTTK